MKRLRTRIGPMRRLARLLAVTLAVLPWLGAVLAADVGPPRDAMLLCTAHGPVLVRIDPASGDVQEVPATPGAPSHACCLVSVACGAPALPDAPGPAIAPRAAAGAAPFARHQAAVSPDLAHRIAANPVRGPPPLRLDS